MSLSVEKGEFVALVGESGSGKSVTALSILQLIKNANQSGSIRLSETEMIGQTESLLQQVRGDNAGMIFQEPMTSLNPLHTIGKQVAEIIQIHSKTPLTRKEALQKVSKLFEDMNFNRLKKRLDAYPHELSGGQRQRVMIAMAIANNPDLLIADEPTTALDVIISANILRILKKLQKKRNMAVLLITHDLTIVRKLSERVYVMKNGEIVESGKTEEVFANPKHEYTKKLINSAPKGGAVEVKGNSPTVIECKDLKVAFPIKGGFLGRKIGEFKAVKKISLKVPEGKTIGIVGESGSGKTTLALALLRLVKSTGKIILNGANIEEYNNKQMRPLRQNMQVVFQDPFASLNPRMTVEQIINEGLEAHNLKADIDEVLKEVGLEPEMKHRYPHEFSGGQRQRIGIARAIALNPKLIMLDEPTSALDLTVQTQIIDLLRKLQRERKISYIFITHDLRVMRAVAHEIAVMKDGHVVEYGTTKEIFENPQTEYTQKLIKAAFLEKSA